MDSLINFHKLNTTIATDIHIKKQNVTCYHFCSFPVTAHPPIRDNHCRDFYHNK